MKRVLIADDAKFIRLMLRKILTSNGYDVVAEAATGEECIKLYAKFHPDLVTMDIVMPELDGIETVRHIRDFDPEARIVIVTALYQEPMIMEALEAGAVNFIVTPFKPEKVIATVDKVMLNKFH